MGQSEYSAFEAAIAYRFKDEALLRLALTHPSCAKTEDDAPYNNQRLEFLGDSVLALLVAELLYSMYPHEQEGDLARRHSALVNGAQLSEVAKTLGLGESLQMSRSEEECGGRENASNLEDACEALIGAIYLDGGLQAAQAFVHAHWSKLAEAVSEPPKDPKTGLQEWAQARGLGLPVYRVASHTGPAHAPEFTISVEVEGYPPAQAVAGSKKQGERDAAEALLASVEKD